MTTTTIKTKNYLPLAITQLHVDNMLEYDTNWINNEWDGNWETLRDAISDGDYNDYPYMLYGGSKAQRHELHRKLGSNFEHTSINMDDGSRVMIIINYPGWIHTGDDLSVCFFTSAPWHGTHWLPKDNDDRVQAEARTRVYKMGPRTVAMYLPQQQYESKSDADQRIADAQTLDSWRERANLLIGHAAPETQEEYDRRIAAEKLQKAEENHRHLSYHRWLVDDEHELHEKARQAELEVTKARAEAALHKISASTPEDQHTTTSEPQDELSNGSIPLHKISSNKSLLIAQKLLTTDIAGAIDIAHKSGVSQYSDSLEGRLIQGDIQMATQLAMQRILDANIKAMQERMNARAEAWSEMSEPPPQPRLERHVATASLCGNE